MGITNFGGTATGVAGAVVAAWLLNRYIFPYGFVACFGIAAIFIFFSWISLALTHEQAVINRKTSISTREYWKILPGILRSNNNFTWFIISQVVINLGGMAWGFLAVYSQQQWHLSDGTVGGFTATMLIGQALANLLFGVLADRKGYKIVLEISIILAILTLVITILAPSPQWFNLVFFLRGATTAGIFLTFLFVFEFSSVEIRPTYIGLTNTIGGIASGAAPLLGGWLALALGYKGLFWAGLLVSAAGFVIIHWFVHDPRHASK